MQDSTKKPKNGINPTTTNLTNTNTNTHTTHNHKPSSKGFAICTLSLRKHPAILSGVSNQVGAKNINGVCIIYVLYFTMLMCFMPNQNYCYARMEFYSCFLERMNLWRRHFVVSVRIRDYGDVKIKGDL